MIHQSVSQSAERQTDRQTSIRSIPFADDNNNSIQIVVGSGDGDIISAWSGKGAFLIEWR